MKDIKIRDDFIKLGQAMKLAGIVDSGALAKERILAEEVKVNGEICTVKGKKIYPGDRIEFAGTVLNVAAAK